MLINKIGKYKIYKDDNSLKIRYAYSFTDFVGVLWYLLSLVIGGLLLTIAIYKFSFDNITNWLMLLGGFGLTIFSFVMILMSLYNPRNGILEIRHDIEKVVIRDFLKKELIDIDDIVGFYYKLETVYKPKQRYAIIYLKTYSNEKIDCFIIRSHYSLDKTREVEKELHKVSKSICNIISEEIL